MDLSILFPFIILLLFIPLFLNGRRQRRQMQEMQQMQAALTEGDHVMTTSGLRGTVVDASYEETVDLEIAPGVVTTWVRAAIREKIKPTAAEDTADTAATADSAKDSAAETTSASSDNSASAESAGTEAAKDRSTS